MQYFKGDSTEIKYDESAKTLLDIISVDLNTFFDESFDCFVLGDVIWDSDRSPLANAINKSIFRESFPAIFEVFLEAGSFEGYLSVFRNIFGDGVDVSFTVPAAGKLEIDITSDQVVLSDLVAREVVNNAYVFSEIIDHEDDNIAVQSIKGMESEAEVEQMLFELVPDGIYTEITLTIG